MGPRPSDKHSIDRIDNASVGTLIRIYQAQGLDEKNAYVKLYSSENHLYTYSHSQMNLISYFYLSL